MPTARSDLDLAWKEALTGWLPDFLALFVLEAHAAIDWGCPVEFLESELRRLRRAIPGGARRNRMQVDLVVRVHLRDGQEAMVLLHVEVQAQRDPDFQLRMRLYHDRLFDRHRVPVFSLAVLADSSPSWRPRRHEVSLWGCRSVLEFPVIKLLDWRSRRDELEASENPFTLVVAAHLAVLETKPDQPARKEAALRLVRRLLQRGLGREQVYGLYTILEGMMAMSESLTEAFDQEVLHLEEEFQMRLITRSERRGIAKGRAEGREEALRTSILQFCEARFGEIPAGLPEALASLRDDDALQRLIRLAATANTASQLLDAGKAEQGASLA